MGVEREMDGWMGEEGWNGWIKGEGEFVQKVQYVCFALLQDGSEDW